MQLETVVRKMEEYVQDFRAQLEKKDFDSLAVLTNNMQQFFDDLEQELPANADFGGNMEEIKECAVRFGEACERSDMQEASRALSDMENTVQSLKRQCPSAAA